MPAQQRGRLHDQAAPGRVGQQPRQASQQGPVCPVEPWPSCPASQHRDLVAQHERLGVLGCRAPCQQRKPPQHLAAQQVEQSQGHAPIIAADGFCDELAARTHDRFSGTHTFRNRCVGHAASARAW
jgi:hypothetical protein